MLKSGSVNGDLPQLFERLLAGDKSVPDELTTGLYRELRKIANRHLSRERANHTLQATALVHETWLKRPGADQRPGAGRQTVAGSDERELDRIGIAEVDRQGCAVAAAPKAGDRVLPLADLSNGRTNPSMPAARIFAPSGAISATLSAPFMCSNIVLLCGFPFSMVIGSPTGLAVGGLICGIGGALVSQRSRSL